MKHKQKPRARKIRGEKNKHTYTIPYIIAAIIGYYILILGFRLDSAAAMICGAAAIVASVYQYVSLEFRNHTRMGREQEKNRILSKRKDENDEFIRTYHKKPGAPQMPQQIIRMKTVRVGNGKREVLRDETRVQKKKAV